MSMNRLLARLAVVNALSNFKEAPWPTLAGSKIFDSKVEPVEDMKLEFAFPLCVVYTDYDKDHWNYGKMIHRDRLMTITLEMLIVTAEAVIDENGNEVLGEYQLDCPMTDSELETSLDAFEVQVFRALTSGENAASDLFMYLCPSYASIVSRRGATIEGGRKLAARQMTLEMKALRDPIEGNVPTAVDAFLTRLALVGDYAERVEEIRAMITAPAALSPVDRLRRGIGFSKATAQRLGLNPGAPVVLPPEITYIYDTGTP